MREYILRMARNRIPLSTAVRIYADFKRRGKLHELNRYLDSIENGGGDV